MTAQIHEILILDRQRRHRDSMSFCPPLPHHLDVVVNAPSFSKGDDSDDESNDDDSSHRIRNSTACWRGYQGTWEIRDDRFYLVSIKGQYRLASPQPVLADWFTGVLRIPQRELLEYVHMGFGSVYERELHIKIEQGLVVDQRTIDNRTRNHNWYELGLNNLPGDENRFDGDDF